MPEEKAKTWSHLFEFLKAKEELLGMLNPDVVQAVEDFEGVTFAKYLAIGRPTVHILISR